MYGISQRSVAVGRRYMVKIGSRLAEVEVVGIQTAPRWRCHVRTLDTNRTILVKGVQRLRPVQDTVAAMSANAAAKRDGIAAALKAREAREDAARAARQQAEREEVTPAQAAAAAWKDAATWDEAIQKAKEQAEVREGVRRLGRLLGGFLG